MQPIIIAHRLPFISVSIHANGKVLNLAKVLLDTGSGGSVFNTDDLEKIGVVMQPTDHFVEMTGVGGSEYVVEKQVDSLEVGVLRVSPFTIQIGALNYGTAMDGILGVDFLLQAGAHLDFKTLTLSNG